MSSENESSVGGTSRLGRRGMSMTMAIVVMVVVIVVVGGAGFAALSAVSGSGNKTVSSCSPPNSPARLSSSGTDGCGAVGPLRRRLRPGRGDHHTRNQHSGNRRRICGEAVSDVCVSTGAMVRTTRELPRPRTTFTTRWVRMSSAPKRWSGRPGTRVRNTSTPLTLHPAIRPPTPFSIPRSRRRSPTVARRAPSSVGSPVPGP